MSKLALSNVLLSFCYHFSHSLVDIVRIARLESAEHFATHMNYMSYSPLNRLITTTQAVSPECVMLKVITSVQSAISTNQSFRVEVLAILAFRTG